jgi:hypothetical protein
VGNNKSCYHARACPVALLTRALSGIDFQFGTDVCVPRISVVAGL